MTSGAPLTAWIGWRRYCGWGRLVAYEKSGLGVVVVDWQGSWPAVKPPPGMVSPAPFPEPHRPVFREPHPIGAAATLAGIGGALLWFALFGALGRDLASYAWWTIVAAITAWIVAGLLTLLGDRGVATGVALTSGVALSIATCFVAMRWMSTGNWPLW